MSHFDHMPENKVTPLMVVDIVCQLSEIFASLFFDLWLETNFTSRGLKFRYSIKEGIRIDLIVYWGF